MASASRSPSPEVVFVDRRDPQRDPPTTPSPRPEPLFGPSSPRSPPEYTITAEAVATGVGGPSLRSGGAAGGAADGAAGNGEGGAAGDDGGRGTPSAGTDAEMEEVDGEEGAAGEGAAGGARRSRRKKTKTDRYVDNLGTHKTIMDLTRENQKLKDNLRVSDKALKKAREDYATLNARHQELHNEHEADHRRLDRMHRDRNEAVAEKSRLQTEFNAEKARMQSALKEQTEISKRARCVDIHGLSQEELDKLRMEIDKAMNEALLRIQDAELWLTAKANVEELRPRYCCTFTKQIFQDPVQASDGFTYEREMIEKWLNDTNAYRLLPMPSPRGGEFVDRRVIPNLDFKAEILAAIDEEFDKLKRERDGPAKGNGGAAV